MKDNMEVGNKEEERLKNSLEKNCFCQAAMAHAFNPSTMKIGAKGPLWVGGQSGAQGEFQEIQGYTEKPYL